MADTIDLILALQTSNALSAFDGFVNKISGNNKLAAIGLGMTKSVSAPIVAGLGLATQKAIEFNTILNNTSRTLDLTESETKAFGTEVLKLAPSVGLLPKELAKVSAEAGKLGVSKNEVVEFGTALAKLSAISDVPIDDFTKKAGAIKQIFKQNTEAFNEFGAATNALDDKIGGTSQNILTFTARVGATGKQIGLTAAEVAAFGSVFESLGIQPSRAGTAFETFVQTLSTLPYETPKVQKAMQALGYDVNEFSTRMTNDPKTAIREFLTRINSIKNPVEKTGLLLEIFGKNSSSEIAALAGRADLLGKAFDVANDKVGNAAKMQDEFSKKLRDPAVQMKILQGQFEAIAISVGTALLPALTDILGTITPVVAKISEFAANNPEVTKLFVAFALGAAVLGPLVAIVGGVWGAFTTLFTAVSGGLALVTSLGGLWSTLGLIFGTVISTVGGLVSAFFSVPVAIAAVVAGAVALIFNIGGCRDKLIALASTIGGVVMGQLNNLKGMALSLGTAIVNLGMQFSNGLANAVRTGVNAGISAASQLVNAVRTNLQGMVTAAYNMGSAFRSAISNAVSSAISVLSNLRSAGYNAGLGLMNSFGQGVYAAAQAAYSRVASAVASIRNLLPSSPAKEGALSDLDKSGEALFKTFANNLTPDYLRDKVNQGLAALGINDTANTLGIGSSSTPSQLTPAAVTTGGGVSPVINYTQNIDINAEVNAAEIIAALKSRQREFLDFISQADFFTNRRQR